MLTSSANTTSLHKQTTFTGKTASATERRTTLANNAVTKTTTNAAQFKRGNTNRIDSKTPPVKTQPKSSSSVTNATATSKVVNINKKDATTKDSVIKKEQKVVVEV